MPLIRRLPRRGFNNARFRRKWSWINIGDLNVFPDDTEVTPELLLERGLVKDLGDGLKVLGEGRLERRLLVRAHAFSRRAREEIEARGGQAEVIGGSGN
jgi:large subunit ribosomal protein L15